MDKLYDRYPDPWSWVTGRRRERTDFTAGAGGTRPAPRAVFTPRADRKKGRVPAGPYASAGTGDHRLPGTRKPGRGLPEELVEVKAVLAEFPVKIGSPDGMDPAALGCSPYARPHGVLQGGLVNAV
jgi:hypothetical protein